MVKCNLYRNCEYCKTKELLLEGFTKRNKQTYPEVCSVCGKEARINTKRVDVELPKKYQKKIYQLKTVQQALLKRKSQNIIDAEFKDLLKKKNRKLYDEIVRELIINRKSSDRKND